LTDLVSLACTGGRIEIDEEYYDLVFLGGGWNDQTRFALRRPNSDRAEGDMERHGRG